MLKPFISFVEYEAEAWETRSHLSDNTRPRSPSNQAPSQHRSGHGGRSASPLSYAQSQPADDYYRNTNVVNPNRSNAQSVREIPRSGGPPQLTIPMMGPGSFGGFGGSQGPSEYGPAGIQAPIQLPQPTGMSMTMGVPSYTGSLYAMPPPAIPRNSVMTNLNMLSGNQGGVPELNMFGGPRPSSTTLTGLGHPNPFESGPSQSADPSDEELLVVLRAYLSTQDLMTITKKYIHRVQFRLIAHPPHRSAREAVASQFPNADLSDKKEFLNSSIESILSS